MQCHAIMWSPLLPLLRNLSDSSIGRTRHVTNYSIELVERTIRLYEVREVLSIMVYYYDLICVQSVHLMSKHKGSVLVSIVSDDKAGSIFS